MRGSLSCTAGRSQADTTLDAFQQVVFERKIPIEYPSELLAGMAMDAEGVHYETLSDLLRYCYRVAGTVGLMMCHVLGVKDDRALIHAAHLGMAMQLTNVCRDVIEDWERGQAVSAPGAAREPRRAGLHRSWRAFRRGAPGRGQPA